MQKDLKQIRWCWKS